MPRLTDALAAGAFRASEAFELVLFDRLLDFERQSLADLQRDSSFYGVLRPSGQTTDLAGAGPPQRSIRAVDRETALLLLTMRDPGRLPAYALHADPTGQGILALLLDGVLEVRHEDRFVSGALALDLLMEPTTEYEVSDRLSRMSLEALHYAASLDLGDRSAVASRLYAFGRWPLSPVWVRRYPDSVAVLKEVADGAPLGVTGWRSNPDSRTGWIPFQREPRTGKALRDNGHDTLYKLYVSPEPASLRDAFHAVIEVLARRNVRRFKLGSDAAGLLRPDKLVIYFDDLATLESVATDLSKHLEGMPAHGVPFTAEIACDGLLSWGVDPPPESRPISWQPIDSWRTWVTRFLAGALIEAKRSPGTISPARFALERLRLEGVDVDRWVPSATLWRRFP